MTTTADNRLSVPNFPDALNELVDLALKHPDNVTPNSYVRDDEAFCLIGRAYIAQGGDIEVLKTKNNIRMQIAWNTFYTRHSIFLDLRDNACSAQDNLVYHLYANAQYAQDFSRDNRWKPALITALRKTRRQMLSPTSGFLVQTHGEHKDLLDLAIVEIDDAIHALTK